MEQHSGRQANRPPMGVSLALLVVFVLAGLFNGLAQRDYANAAFEVFRTKVLHAEAAQGPQRLLLTGGSNAVWDYRSPLLEKALGVPTTNLGLDREGDAPRANRALVLDTSRSGDTVVYSSVEFWNLASYSESAAQDLLRSAGISEKTSWLGNLRYYADRYWGWTPRDAPIITSFSFMYDRFVRKTPTVWYYRFNAYGDIKACEPATNFFPNNYAPPQNRAEFLAEMMRFEVRLRERGANLVIDIPKIYVKPDELALWQRSYAPVLAELSAHVPVATTRISEVITSDVRFFCNSPNHLNETYAQLRTKQLAEYLLVHGLRPGRNASLPHQRSPAEGHKPG